MVNVRSTIDLSTDRVKCIGVPFMQLLSIKKCYKLITSHREGPSVRTRQQALQEAAAHKMQHALAGPLPRRPRLPALPLHSG